MLGQRVIGNILGNKPKADTKSRNKKAGFVELDEDAIAFGDRCVGCGKENDNRDSWYHCLKCTKEADLK